MKRLLLASLLCGFAFAASAQSVTISGQAEAETTLTQPDHDDKFDDRLCLRQTGSRIVAAHNDHRDRNTASADTSAPRCVAANGRVYTREDIDSTGAIDLAEALRRLDPSIR